MQNATFMCLSTIYISIKNKIILLEIHVYIRYIFFFLLKIVSIDFRKQYKIWCTNRYFQGLTTVKYSTVSVSEHSGSCVQSLNRKQ